MPHKQTKTIHSKKRGFSSELKLFSIVAATIILGVLSFVTFVALQNLSSGAADKSSLGSDVESDLPNTSPYFKISFVTQQSIGIVANNDERETEAERASSAFLQPITIQRTTTPDDENSWKTTLRSSPDDQEDLGLAGTGIAKFTSSSPVEQQVGLGLDDLATNLKRIVYNTSGAPKAYKATDLLPFFSEAADIQPETTYYYRSLLPDSTADQATTAWEQSGPILKVRTPAYPKLTIDNAEDDQVRFSWAASDFGREVSGAFQGLGLEYYVFRYDASKAPSPGDVMSDYYTINQETIGNTVYSGGRQGYLAPGGMMLAQPRGTTYLYGLAIGSTGGSSAIAPTVLKIVSLSTPVSVAN